MFYLLELREKIKKFYQEKETIAVAIFKFIMSFVIFYTITHNLDYNSMFSNILVILLLSLIGAFVPSTIITFLAMVVASLEVFYFSSVLGIAVIGVLLILYCLFIRFTPKLGIAVLAVPIAFALKIPCFIPIVLGIISTPISVVAVGCGTILYYLLDAVRNVHKIVGDTAEDGGQIYTFLIKQFKNNSAMIFTIIVFIAITLIEYEIRTREINYTFEVAILTGCIVNLLSFLIANLLNDIKIPVHVGELILGTLGAGLLALVVQNFRCALDYSTIERVQFEDDDYFYYVKAIPKIKVVEKKSDIKKIAVQKPVEHKINELVEENISKDFDDDFDKNFDKGFDNDFSTDKTLEENLNKELKKELDIDINKELEEIDEEFSDSDIEEDKESNFLDKKSNRKGNNDYNKESNKDSSKEEKKGDNKEDNKEKVKNDKKKKSKDGDEVK